MTAINLSVLVLVQVYKIILLLKSAGHHVTSLDLGAIGINPKNNAELDSLSDYAQSLMDLVASLPQDEKVILVGHSYGGVSISLAMESFPLKVSAAVYLTAFMPTHHSPIATGVAEFYKKVMAEPIMAFQLWFDDGSDNLPTHALFGPKHMEAKVYQLSPKEDIKLAKTLLREGKWFMKDLWKEYVLIKENFRSGDSVYIVCKDDLLPK